MMMILGVQGCISDRFTVLTRVGSTSSSSSDLPPLIAPYPSTPASPPRATQTPNTPIQMPKPTPTPTPKPTPTAGAHFEKVFIVVLENTDKSEALQQPFMSQLTTRGALLNNYFAIGHP